MENNNLLIELLYQMAYADGVFNTQEKAFITQVMEEKGFSADKFIENKAEIPKDESQRMSILYYLLFLIRIDGKISQAERNFAHKFGMRLGFREEMVKDMLDVMEQHLDSRLPDEKLVQIIRQYKN